GVNEALLHLLDDLPIALARVLNQRFETVQIAKRVTNCLLKFAMKCVQHMSTSDIEVHDARKRFADASKFLAQIVGLGHQREGTFPDGPERLPRSVADQDGILSGESDCIPRPKLAGKCRFHK